MCTLASWTEQAAVRECWLGSLRVVIRHTHARTHARSADGPRGSVAVSTHMDVWDRASPPAAVPRPDEVTLRVDSLRAAFGLPSRSRARPGQAMVTHRVDGFKIRELRFEIRDIRIRDLNFADVRVGGACPHFTHSRVCVRTFVLYATEWPRTRTRIWSIAQRDPCMHNKLRKEVNSISLAS